MSRTQTQCLIDLRNHHMVYVKLDFYLDSSLTSQISMSCCKSFAFSNKKRPWTAIGSVTSRNPLNSLLQRIELNVVSLMVWLVTFRYVKGVILITRTLLMLIWMADCDHKCLPLAPLSPNITQISYSTLYSLFTFLPHISDSELLKGQATIKNVFLTYIILRTVTKNSTGSQILRREGEHSNALTSYEYSLDRRGL